MRGFLIGLCVVLVTTCVGVATASAQQVQYASGPSGNVFNPDTYWWTDNTNITVGNKFTSNVTANVTALGIWDWTADLVFPGFEAEANTGLRNDSPVGLWDASGTLLASVTIPARGGLPLDGYRWENLATPVMIQQGQTYVLGALFSNPGGTSTSHDVWADNISPFSIAGAIDTTNFTFLETLEVENPSLTFPTTSDTGLVWFGPNLQANVVPEPATIIIWSLLGGLGIAIAHLRHRKAA